MKKLEKGIEGDLNDKDAHRNFMPTTLNIPFVMLMFAYIYRYIYMHADTNEENLACIANKFKCFSQEKIKKWGFLEFERKIK